LVVREFVTCSTVRGTERGVRRLEARVTSP